MSGSTAAPEYTEQQQAVIERVREELMNGRTFRLVAASARSRYGYQPPLRREAYAQAVTTLGQMAARSNALAQVAAACLARINLYGTAGEERAHVYEAAAEALKNYDDVIGRAAPDAGRHSSHQRDFTLAERIEIAYWLNAATAKMQSGVPAVGWCLEALRRAEQVNVPAHLTER